MACFISLSLAALAPPTTRTPRMAGEVAHRPGNGLRQALPSCSRRQAIFSAAVASFPLAAAAAQDVGDLSRLQKGLGDVQFLLDNWVQETTNPTSGAMDPDRVRVYLGLRSTSSPLFQIDKLLTKAQNKVDPDRFEEWIEAVEGWDSHLNKVNELAYTSSFGEYNPGGGKDQIAKYLELAREEVVLCRDSLKKMIELLPM
ncbi:hypothetical protein AB1Y20_023498 [Prymnesium parvum]|uniref:Uncharacterized protein n=1 Tax=Prymnesium parvum TaxID=97485 RepID=A0AB34JDH5_PRYPA